MSITVTEAGTIAEWESRLATAEREAGEKLRVAEAYRKIVEGFRELNGNAPRVAFVEPVQATLTADTIVTVESAGTVDKPRGRDAILRITDERPGMWTLAELRAEMKARGWWTSDKAVEVAVHRLRRAGKARFVRPGLYEFPPYYEERDAA